MPIYVNTWESFNPFTQEACAFCSHWVDPKDTHIRKRLILGWEFDMAACEYCAVLEKNADANGHCKNYDCKLKYGKMGFCMNKSNHEGREIS